MEDKKHIAPELLAKYFAGACSQEETGEVETWKAANEEAYLSYLAVWKDTGMLRSTPPALDVDTEQAWQKVKKTLKSKESETPSITVYWRIAAVLLLGFGLGFWLASPSQSPQGSNTFAMVEKTGVVNLEDGSSITLNQNSALTVIEGFNGNNRVVSMKGEAYFDITSDPEHPFEITAGLTKVTVLGTSFNVKMEASGVVEVVVNSGIVTFGSTTQEVKLAAGETGRFDSITQKLEKVTTEPTGISTFWKDHRLTFDNQKLREVASTLERAYGIQILLDGNQLDNCQLHVSFDNSTVDEVMEIIALTLELQVEKQGDNYLLRGKGCGN